MYRAIFLTEAINEMKNAEAWYAEKQTGLDIKFTENVFAAIEKLQSDQVVYGVVYRKLSRIAVKRFPYVVYFKKNTELKQIVIFGVLHQKQDRANLNKRI